MIILVVVYFAAIVSINSNSLNQIALYIAIPFAFILCFLYNTTIRNNRYMQIIVLLFTWVCIASIGTIDMELTLRELRQILGVFLLCYIIASLAKHNNLIIGVYGVYIVLYLSAWYYAKNNILNIMDFGTERLNDGKLNANTMAYYTFYVTYIVFILGLFLKGKAAKYTKIIFPFAIILSFYVAILTGSRQVLIIQIPLIAVLLYQRYLKLSLKSLFTVGIIVSSIYFAYSQWGEKQYNDSILKQRNEQSIAKDSRSVLIEKAVKVSLDNPIFGVGPGCFKKYTSAHTFSHCTFVELSANTGIIGMVLFILLITTFLKRQWLYYKKTRDKKFVVFAIFGCFFCIDNFFFVFYLDMWLLSFFVLVATHSDTYYAHRKSIVS
jgi:hypothetical protein